MDEIIVSHVDFLNGEWRSLVDRIWNRYAVGAQMSRIRHSGWRAGVALFCAVVATTLGATSAFAQAPAAGFSPPLLRVLRDTGTTRDGQPVYEAHPDGARYVAALTRGFSGRLLRLYALEQHYLQATRGIEPEPAYLLLSTHMGGFPRFGFFLGTRDKRTAGYVDLTAAREIGGRFGSMDQIFPHELGHVIV